MTAEGEQHVQRPVAGRGGVSLRDREVGRGRRGLVKEAGC